MKPTTQRQMSAAGTAFVIGRRYVVPAVLANRFYGLSDIWIPVIGPRHEDSEVIRFPHMHWHIDWRFAPSKLWNRFHHRPSAARYGIVLNCPNMDGDRVVIEGPQPRRMTCKRDLPPYPHKYAQWSEALREHMRQRGCDALVNGRCPHRGVPAESMIRDGDVLTCPAHGLQFSATTGLLLASAPSEASQ